MKFTFNPAPNYKCKLSTQQIMRELAIGLLVVYAFSLFYSVWRRICDAGTADHACIFSFGMCR